MCAVWAPGAGWCSPHWRRPEASASERSWSWDWGYKFKLPRRGIPGSYWEHPERATGQPVRSQRCAEEGRYIRAPPAKRRLPRNPICGAMSGAFTGVSVPTPALGSAVEPASSRRRTSPSMRAPTGGHLPLRFWTALIRAPQGRSPPPGQLSPRPQHTRDWQRGPQHLRQPHRSPQ